MNSGYLLFIANHLWQSTLFAAGAWLMTLLLRGNRAAVRHRLWFAASIKFLIPFSVLMSIGTHFQWRTAPAQPALIGQIAAPFVPANIVPQPPAPASGIWGILAVIWMLGVIVNLAWWLTGWLRLRGMIRRAAPVEMNIPVRVMSCSERLEPGIFGIVRPVLLLPAGITDRLSPTQFETVIAHEMCHVRRRDNLISAIHLFVEALFWFHPLLWWIKSRLIAEQERACDEAVLDLGHDPHVYAQSILTLCEFYISSPLICAAGVTGSNLKKRIEEIMRNRVTHPLSPSKRLALIAAALLAVAGPVMIGAGGVKTMPPAQPEKRTEVAPAPVPAQRPAVPAAQRTSAEPAGYVRGLGNVAPSSTALIKSRIDGELLSVAFKEGQMVQAGQLLATVDARPFQLQVAAASVQLTTDQVQLAAARTRQDSAAITQLEGRVAADQAAVQSANLQVAYSQIRSPITGVAGLRLIDPGNIIHANDTQGIVVITQVQPIAVLFTIPEDIVQPVLALLRSGAEVPVEVWDRTEATRLETGRLIAANNQIDTTTGTVQLKALFDNKDNALYPNQFVNVHLIANVR